MENLAIQTINLEKSYRKVKALRGLNLEIIQGEIFGFLGPNGAGKTTTIRCLLDLIRPDRGEISMLGLDPQKQSAHVRARAGYLPGELRLDENMSARDMLHYFNALRNRSADWKHVQELTSRLDLDLDNRIKNLSRGNKQKIGVVQALMHQPELLLLDEPTTGLDPLIQQEVYALLREASAKGTTVFFSSHIINEVEQLAQRVAIIRKGVAVEVVAPDSLVNRSLRRAWVRFNQPVRADEVANLPGAVILSRSGTQAYYLQVAGNMTGLVKALANLPVVSIDTEHPSLEEVFLAFYKNDEKD